MSQEDAPATPDPDPAPAPQPHVSAGGHGTRAIVAALLANLGIAVAKFVAFAITRSSSMLAESLHSVADSGNQLLLLLGGRQGRRAADTVHPFGYGRSRYFAAFVVSIVLFSGGALFSLYEGTRKLLNPHELESPLVAVVVLVLAIGLESWSMRTAVHEARPLRRPGQSWWDFVRETKQPEIVTVLLEDAAALIGLLLALVGVGLAAVTGNPVYDALGTLAIGALLAAVAAVLAVEMHSLLLGEAAAPHEITAIHAAVVGTAGIRQVIHLRTMHLGPDDLLVAAKIEADPALSGPALAAVVDHAEERLRAAVPTARVVHLEPDVRRTPG